MAKIWSQDHVHNICTIQYIFIVTSSQKMLLECLWKILLFFFMFQTHNDTLSLKNSFCYKKMMCCPSVHNSKSNNINIRLE